MRYQSGNFYLSEVDSWWPQELLGSSLGKPKQDLYTVSHQNEKMLGASVGWTKRGIHTHQVNNRPQTISMDSSTKNGKSHQLNLDYARTRQPNNRKMLKAWHEGRFTDIFTGRKSDVRRKPTKPHTYRLSLICRSTEVNEQLPFILSYIFRSRVNPAVINAYLNISCDWMSCARQKI